MNAVTITLDSGNVRGLLVPETAGANERSRLGAFATWLQATGRAWHEPDLGAYRAALLGRMAASSVRAHLATIRARYRALLRDNALRDALYDAAAGQFEGGAERKAFVDEVVTRVENAIHPAASAVKVEIVQDQVDAEQGIRLTREQASALIASPGLDTLSGLRDTALLALALCTGLREAEIAHLEVRDLRQTFDGELCVHVRQGKGCKTRAVPYGAGEWCLAIVDKWLGAAGIEQGAVFRGFYKGGQRLRSNRLTTRAVQQIVRAYPVMVKGAMTRVAPHDLRRTYARRCYDEGMAPIAIQQNLGHADLNTTLRYIGELDAEQRRPPALYDFDLVALDRVQV